MPIRHIYIHDHRAPGAKVKTRDEKLSREEIAEIRAEKGRKGWSKQEIDEYIKQEENKREQKEEPKK